MKPLPTAALAFGLALATSGAYAQPSSDAQPPTRTQPPTGTQPTQPGVAPTAPMAAPAQQESTLERQDRSFLENAVQASYAEIEGSRLALEKSENPEVQDFAQKMIDEHEAIVGEVSGLAMAKRLTPPEGPSVMQRAEITALKALSGGAFDTMYVNRIAVAAHENSVESFEEASREAQDPEVKALAGQILPRLQEHLRMAQALNEKQDREQ
ncbi:MAG: DUF4142 domain-containing protein [Burkholderiaceae bacterium]